MTFKAPGSNYRHAEGKRWFRVLVVKDSVVGYFSRGALRAAGDPDRLIVLYDEDAGVIAFQPPKKGVKAPAARAGRSIGLQRLANDVGGIKEGRYEVEVEGDTLLVKGAFAPKGDTE